MNSSSPASAVAGPPPKTRASLVRGFNVKHLRFAGIGIPLPVILCIMALALMLFFAIFAHYLSPYDPIEQNLDIRVQPPIWAGGSSIHPLGTDQLGRDLLSRIIYGSRVSLLVGFLSVVFGATLGSSLGLVSAYFGRYVDTLVMMVADVQLAFPSILLAISVIAVLGAGLTNLVLVVVLTGWVTYARIVRAHVLSLKEKEFVMAGRVIGVPSYRIIIRHLLPNTLSPIVVVATLDLARAIIMESLLSFLGLGVQPPTPTWGTMLSDGRTYLATGWWIATFPGLAITLTCFSVNRIGDWLRDLFDPTLRGVML